MRKRKIEDEIIMEALSDYLHHRNYNFRKVNCDPLMKIKRRIGDILLEEFCAISDEQIVRHINLGLKE